MARVLKSDEETWAEAVSFVKKRDESWSDYWDHYHKWCRSIFRLYMAKQQVTTLKKRARLALSLPFTIIETVAAENYKALYDENPYFKQKPVGKEDEEAAETVTQYIGHQCEKNKFRIKGYIFEKNRLMFGLGFAQVPWTFLEGWKRRTVPIMEPVFETDPITGEVRPVLNPMTGDPMMKPSVDFFGKPKTKKEFRKETIFDCWEFEPLFPWHIKCDPAITDPNKIQFTGNGIIRDRYYSTAELKRRKASGIYKNVDDYLLWFDEEGSNYSIPKEEDEESSRDLNAGWSYKRNLHHIMEFWGPAPIVEVERKSGTSIIWDKDAEPVEAMIDICEGHCLRVKRNLIDEQLRPFIATQCHPVSDNLISPGLLQAVESELRELAAFRNARMDNLAQQMEPMYNVRAGVNVNVRDLAYRPRGIVRTPNPETDIVTMKGPDLGQTLDRDMSQIEYNVQNATNALSAAQGASNMGQAFGRTARGIDFFQSRMQTRLQLIVEVAEDQQFGNLSDIINSYNAQFITDPKEFAIIGKQNVYLLLNPDFLNRRDLIPVSASRKLNRGKMLQLFDRMITEASTLGEYIKVDYAIREMIKATDAFPDPDKILYTHEEKEKMQANKPDTIKKGMNLSVSWVDLEPDLKVLLLKDLFPQIAGQIGQQLPQNMASLPSLPENATPQTVEMMPHMMQ